MKRTTKHIAVVLASMVIAAAAAGCQKEGPAERAGKQIDKAVENVKDAVKK